MATTSKDKVIPPTRLERAQTIVAHIAKNIHHKSGFGSSFRLIGANEKVVMLDEWIAIVLKELPKDIE